MWPCGLMRTADHPVDIDSLRARAEVSKRFLKCAYIENEINEYRDCLDRADLRIHGDSHAVGEDDVGDLTGVDRDRRS